MKYIKKLKTTPYCFQKYINKNQSNKISFVDLMLAGRVMSNAEKYLLITGNRKDFPPCIFDNYGVLNTEDPNSGNVRAYSILKFNKEKFDNCYNGLLNSEKIFLEKSNNITVIKLRENCLV